MYSDLITLSMADPSRYTSLSTVEKEMPYEDKIHIIISLILINFRHKHEMDYIFLSFQAESSKSKNIYFFKVFKRYTNLMFFTYIKNMLNSRYNPMHVLNNINKWNPLLHYNIR
jgi:hypothetical protein